MNYTRFPKSRCTICNKWFQPKRSNHDKCSDACRREWHNQYAEKRYAHMKVCRKKGHVPLYCKVCKKGFMGAPHRKNCSPECSQQYMKKRRHFVLKDYRGKISTTLVSHQQEISTKLKLLESFETPDKQKERCHIIDAMHRFRNNGGKITVLMPEPNQPVPDVDLPRGGWGWESNAGMGLFAGVSDYTPEEEI